MNRLVLKDPIEARVVTDNRGKKYRICVRPYHNIFNRLRWDLSLEEHTLGGWKESSRYLIGIRSFKNEFKAVRRAHKKLNRIEAWAGESRFA